MSTSDFDTSSPSLPIAPSGKRIVSVTFKTCPGSDLSIDLLLVNGDSRLDRHGMSPDSWWRIHCSDLPDRVLRLYEGECSMRNLVSRYGFLDRKGCVNHRRATIRYGSSPLPKGREIVDSTVVNHMREARGVPQFYRTSGICWYAALCIVMFSAPRVRNFVKSFLPSDLSRLCDECLFSRSSAQVLRNELWNRYSVGDNIRLNPEYDGCNGFSEFTVLCAKLGIPLVRYKESNGSFHLMSDQVSDKAQRVVQLCKVNHNKPHFLVFRFSDGDHSKFPLCRRIVFRGRRYRWVGCLAGQKKCGHQIAFASSTGHWMDLVIGDADIHKDGIGPIYIRFTGKEYRKPLSDGKNKWWIDLDYLIHITKFGPGNNQFCNLSPHNPSNESLDVYKGLVQRSVGTNSLDFVFLYEP